MIGASLLDRLVWDVHMVSVGTKQMRKPKKDGWFEHGMNYAEYLELNFGSAPKRKSEPLVLAYRSSGGLLDVRKRRIANA